MRKNAGFTLIELVAVMVILAILSVVAVPQFVNLRAEAQTAATSGVAGALSSGSALNYAQRSLNAASGVAVTDCNSVRLTLQGGALPTGYLITASAITAGASANCSVTGPNSSSATFTAIGIN